MTLFVLGIKLKDRGNPLCYKPVFSDIFILSNHLRGFLIMAKLFFILFLLFVLAEQLFYFMRHIKSNDKNSIFFLFSSILTVIAFYLYSIYC